MGARDLLDLRLREFLDGLAAEAPIPGGGAAAAISAAMAASLVSMAARSTPDWEEARGVAAQAEAVRARVAPLALADADAYAEVHAVLRLPAEVEAPRRDEALGKALVRAAELPLAIAESAADAAQLAALAAERGAGMARGDALAAAILAEAATRAAARLVEINLALGAGDPRVVRARELAAAAAEALDRALAGVA